MYLLLTKQLCDTNSLDELKLSANSEARTKRWMCRVLQVLGNSASSHMAQHICRNTYQQEETPSRTASAYRTPSRLCYAYSDIFKTTPWMYKKNKQCEKSRYYSTVVTVHLQDGFEVMVRLNTKLILHQLKHNAIKANCLHLLYNSMT